jgi:hypothetical protein
MKPTEFLGVSTGVTAIPNLFKRTPHAQYAADHAACIEQNRQVREDHYRLHNTKPGCDIDFLAQSATEIWEVELKTAFYNPGYPSPYTSWQDVFETNVNEDCYLATGHYLLRDPCADDPEDPVPRH